MVHYSGSFLISTTIYIASLYQIVVMIIMIIDFILVINDKLFYI